MSSVDEKLDLLINSIKKIEKKLDNFGDRLTKLEEKFDYLENKTDERYKRLNDGVEEKIARLSTRLLEVESFKTEIKTTEIMKESYNKRMNILIHGIEENDASPWETNEQTRKKFNNFVSEGLKLDPEAIAVADIHRLPQRPKFIKGVKVTRPIIIKLIHTKDKYQIFQNLKYLKNFNNNRQK